MKNAEKLLVGTTREAVIDDVAIKLRPYFRGVSAKMSDAVIRTLIGKTLDAAAAPDLARENIAKDEVIADLISFVEHIGSVTGYPGDALAREEFDDKLTRARDALNQGGGVES